MPYLYNCFFSRRPLPSSVCVCVFLPSRPTSTLSTLFLSLSFLPFLISYICFQPLPFPFYVSPIQSSTIAPNFYIFPPAALLCPLPLPLFILFHVVEIDHAWRMRVRASVCVWLCAPFFICGDKAGNFVTRPTERSVGGGQKNTRRSCTAEKIRSRRKEGGIRG